MSRPRVAVTGPDRRLRIAWWATRAVLRSVGAEPRYLHAGHDPDRIERFDALVVGGGDDLDPDLYGEAPAAPSKLDRERDAFEQAVLGRALDEGLPILGICRGAQLLNVTLGGDLHQEIAEQRLHTPNRRTLLARRRIELEPGSRLAAALGTERTRVNSLHHQSVRRPGEGLTIVARDRDGVVQGIEDPARPFRIGVQWHPEYLFWRRRQRALFRALVESA